MSLVKRGVVAPTAVAPRRFTEQDAQERMQQVREYAGVIVERAKARRLQRQEALESKAAVVTTDSLPFKWVPLRSSERFLQLKQNARESGEDKEIVLLGSIKGYVPMRQSAEANAMWRQKLRSKVLEILASATDLPEDQLRRLYDENTSIWQAAFTHEFYDPNNNGNYEQLEKLGDSVIKTAFIDYVVRLRPDIGVSELTEGFNSILSKLSLSGISARLGFRELVRTILNVVTISIAEDLVESFFGAIYQAGEATLGQGAGQGLAFDVFWWLVQDGYLKLPERFEQPYKTQVLSVFTSNGWGSGPEIERTVEGTSHVVKLRLTNTAKQALRAGGGKLDIYDAARHVLEGVPYPSYASSAVGQFINEGSPIGIGRGASLKAAETAAYESAYRKLKDLKILTSLSQEEHNKTNQSYSKSMEPSYAPALRKAVSYGYSNIFVGEQVKTMDKYVSMMYGIKVNKDGSKTLEPIFMLDIPEKWQEEADKPTLTSTKLRELMYDQYVAQKSSFEPEQHVQDMDDESDSEEE